jgi:hypothetical protein
MNTLQDSANKEINGRKQKFIGNEAALMQQSGIIKEFFQKDNGCEIIASLHAMIENFLFTENLSHVTPEMRDHIVNQLRVATLVAKLEKNYEGLRVV